MKSVGSAISCEDQVDPREKGFAVQDQGELRLTASGAAPTSSRANRYVMFPGSRSKL